MLEPEPLDRREVDAGDPSHLRDSDGATRRARSRPPPRRSATRAPAIGIQASRSRSTPSGSPSRSAPSRSTTSPREVELGRAAPPPRGHERRRASAGRRLSRERQRAARARSSPPRRAAPSGRSGRRSPPRARRRRRRRRRCGSACRRCPGSATRQSASVTGRATARRQVGAPVDADHARRVRGASRPRPAAPARRSRPRRAARRARPSRPRRDPRPRTTNRPSLSRQRRSCSLRTSFSLSLSREVITPATVADGRPASPAARPWPARRASRTRRDR